MQALVKNTYSDALLAAKDEVLPSPPQVLNTLVALPPAPVKVTVAGRASTVFSSVKTTAQRVTSSAPSWALYVGIAAVLAAAAYFLLTGKKKARRRRK